MNLKHSIRDRAAFTLVELLVVISIMAILAALAVPALKNIGKGNAQVGAAQQLVNDVARARQLAISDRTTVYMVFVPTNFWMAPSWLSSLSQSERAVATNLMSMELSGYAFVAKGALGDQPGNHQWHYLDTWKVLPQGFMIAPMKFISPPPFYTYFRDPINNQGFTIYPFNFSANIPFPVADPNTESLASGTNSATSPLLPYIAFNYLGQVVSSAFDSDVLGTGVDIPLAQGSVAYPLNPVTKTPGIPSLALLPSAVTESPPGNSTNINYNIVHVDPLTGRATLLYHHVQ